MRHSQEETTATWIEELEAAGASQARRSNHMRMKWWHVVARIVCRGTRAPRRCSRRAAASGAGVTACGTWKGQETQHRPAAWNWDLIYCSSVSFTLIATTGNKQHRHRYRSTRSASCQQPLAYSIHVQAMLHKNHNRLAL